VWWAKASTDYGNLLESTGKETKTAAQEWLNNKLAQMQAGTHTSASRRTTVTTLVGDVVRDYSINNKKSLRDVQHRWKLHLEPFFGTTKAAHVTPDLVEKYKDRRIKEGAENGTINRELAVLRRAFKIGLRLNKVGRVPQFSMLKEAKPREGFLDDERYARLAEACGKQSPWLLTFFEVAAQLSNRKEELLKLRVRDCDFLTGNMRFPDTKNGETRTVPMTASVHALLKMACTGKKPERFVFTWPDGSQVRDTRNAWAAACVAAGEGQYLCRRCDELWGEDKCSKCDAHKFKDRKYKGLIVHDLRRTGIRNMTRRGVSEQVAMKISGHKTASTFRRYNITSEADKQAAAKLIEGGRPNLKVTIELQSGEESKDVVVN
jgi:integrase